MREELFDSETRQMMRRGVCFLAVEKVLDIAGGLFPKPSTPSLPPPPPPAPTRANSAEAISSAQEKERTEALKRKGRKATILSGGQGVVGDAPLSQPAARSAQLLGG